MKKNLIYIFIFALSTCFFVSFSFGQNANRKKIVIEAKVLKVGTPPKIRSGTRRHVYQLVKYEVLNVISGEHKGRIIVVNHLIMFDSDLFNFKEGDTLTLELFPRKKISPVTIESGIREETNDVDIFYIPGKIKLIEYDAKKRRNGNM